MNPVAASVLAYFVGGIPFSNIVSRITTGQDLRQADGPISGSGVYRVAGAVPMIIAGLLDISKGMVAPLLAGGHEHPLVAAIAATFAVIGHNWSPFLQGAGGRGVSLALGSTLVMAWPGTVVIGVSLALGKLMKHTALVCFLGFVALIPVLSITDGFPGFVLAVGLVVPNLLKRVLGNAPPLDDDPSVYLRRLLLDRDEVPQG